jgi:hypothetical protein
VTTFSPITATIYGLAIADGIKRPVSDGMLYAPKLSTCSKHRR